MPKVLTRVLTPLSWPTLLLPLYVGACDDARDKIVGHVYAADIETFEVIGDEEATRENRKLLRDAEIGFNLMFYNKPVKLWRGDKIVEGTWTPAESTGEQVSVAVHFNEDVYGDGEATFGPRQESVDLTMELPVMTWAPGQGSGNCLTHDGKTACARTAADMLWLKKRTRLRFALESRYDGK